MEARTLSAAPVTYASVGGTRAFDLLAYPPAGTRSSEHRARVGHGQERWDFVTSEVMSWGIQRRSGLRIESVAPAVERDEQVFSADGHELIRAGDTAVLRFGPFRAPVRVVYTVDEPDAVGFGSGTLAGHPLTGEECFLAERRKDGSVWIVVRSFFRPTGSWQALSPALRLLRAVLVRRYLRALAVKLR